MGTPPVAGMLGGMSWESSALYYRLMNEEVSRRLGGHHNARSVLLSFDFDQLLAWAEADRWDRVSEAIADGARLLQRTDVSFVLITSVTGHASADAVSSTIDVPLLHIADPLAAAIHARGLRRVGLLATRFTLEHDVLGERLRGEHDIDVVAPAGADRDELHRIIIDELTLGRVRPKDRETVLAISRRLVDDGAQAIVVACTELPLLLQDDDYPVPALDATRLHAEAAVDRLLADG